MEMACLTDLDSELLQGYLAEDGTKIIVFSQFVSYLDLCSIYLRRLGIEYRPYTGAMRQVEREDIVREFTGPTANANSPRVLLISLKCGGVGLNLTAASKVNIAFTDKDSQRLILQVISLDLAWNAATG
jgi:SNF2 family DNA or RNA helicase